MADLPTAAPTGGRGSVDLFGHKVSWDAILITAGGIVAALFLYRQGKPSGAASADPALSPGGTGFGEPMTPMGYNPATNGTLSYAGQPPSGNQVSVDPGGGGTPGGGAVTGVVTAGVPDFSTFQESVSPTGFDVYANADATYHDVHNSLVSSVAPNAPLHVLGSLQYQGQTVYQTPGGYVYATSTHK